MKKADNVQSKSLAREKQAEQILEAAKCMGDKGFFLFDTAFHRYLKQLEIMDALEEAINADGALVEKEYVRGRANVYTNPAITEYNKTSTAANGTVGTLMSILKSFGEGGAKDIGSMLNTLMHPDE